MKTLHEAMARLRGSTGAAAVLGLTLAAHPAIAAGNASKGAAVFIRQCSLCHTIDRGGRNGFGPNLFGIADRKAGTAPGYKYSPAFLSMANWTWSPDGIASFVVAPGKTIPGNRMGVLQGVADKDLDDLIAYIAAQK
jgi:cytochrome c